MSRKYGKKGKLQGPYKDCISLFPTTPGAMHILVLVLRIVFLVLRNLHLFSV